MQQQQSSTQFPPQDVRQRQSTEQLQIEQRQRQDALHYRQTIEPTTSQTSDDTGTRQAKENLERRKAQEQGDALLRRSESELERSR
jgi:hypothetical protein